MFLWQHGCTSNDFSRNFFNAVNCKNCRDGSSPACVLLTDKNRHHFLSLYTGRRAKKHVSLKNFIMSNRSNLPPNQDQKKFVQDEEVGKGTDTSRAKKNKEPN